MQCTGIVLCYVITGVKRRLAEHASLTPEEEEYVSGILDALFTFVPRRQHAYVSGQQGKETPRPPAGKRRIG